MVSELAELGLHKGHIAKQLHLSRTVMRGGNRHQRAGCCLKPSLPGMSEALWKASTAVRNRCLGWNKYNPAHIRDLPVELNTWLQYYQDERPRLSLKVHHSFH